jgi:ABC-type sugar transport system substrate-binding protein
LAVVLFTRDAGRDVINTLQRGQARVADGRGLSKMTRIAGFMVAALLIMTTAASAETVGFAQVGSESDWRTAFSADMRAEAKIRGIDLRFDDAQGNVERQFAAVRRFIAERVDAIVIAPVIVTGWTPVLKEAQAAHIPVNGYPLHCPGG